LEKSLFSQPRAQQSEFVCKAMVNYSHCINESTWFLVDTGKKKIRGEKAILTDVRSGFPSEKLLARVALDKE
jgi:hypothetical protein